MSAIGMTTVNRQRQKIEKQFVANDNLVVARRYKLMNVWQILKMHNAFDTVGGKPHLSGIIAKQAKTALYC